MLITIADYAKQLTMVPYTGSSYTRGNIQRAAILALSHEVGNTTVQLTITCQEKGEELGFSACILG